MVALGNKALAGIKAHTQQVSHIANAIHEVEKSIGDDVFAATMILEGQLHVQVKKTGQDTVAAQIGTVYLTRRMGVRVKNLVESHYCRRGRMSHAWGS